MKNKDGKKLINSIKAVVLAMLFAVLIQIVKNRASQPQQEISEPKPAAAQQLEVPEIIPEIKPEEEPDDNAGRLIISEIMIKNRSTLFCPDLGFLDWFELKNVSDEKVLMDGWSVSDIASGSGWTFPAGVEIESGEYLVVYAAGAGIKSEGLYTDFALSESDELTLRTPRGSVSDSVRCADTAADESYALNQDGVFKVCRYSTPGYENTLEAYCVLQSELKSDGPVIINEVDASNFTQFYDREKDEHPDWIELKNVSGSSVGLSGWTLTDDASKPDKILLPDVAIAPGGMLVIKCCDKAETHFDGQYVITDLGLNGENEQLYLFNNGTLADYLTVTDVSYGGSVGRMPGENGIFKFTEPTPGADNAGGFRYMCPKPETAEPDGIFEDVEGVTVTLSGCGDIYYTLDGSIPTHESTLYTEPLYFDKTTVVRAVCSDGTGIDSRPLTASYIINEGHTVPVVSVVGDDAVELERIYRQGQKDIELPGAIEYFSGEISFSMDCGLRMAGRASLGRPQKNMTFKFRGRYGDSTLDFPLYDEGLDTFSALTIRSGHDSTKAVIRNEIAEDICLACTDNVVAQRSKWCVMYLNGQYYGLFALKDKLNEDFIAAYYDIDKESVEMDEYPIVAGNPFYKEVVDFTIRSDMNANGNYEYLCSILDIDSFLDWIIMEQYTGNFDILYGNSTFFRSEQLDGNRWKAIFFDLDVAFRHDYYSFRNFFNIDYQLNVYAQMLTSLFKVEEFRDKYLSRVGELLSTTLTNENVTAMIKEMYSVIDDEMPRECKRWDQSYKTYIKCRDELCSMIIDFDYESYAVETIKTFVHLTDEEVAKYFGR